MGVLRDQAKKAERIQHEKDMELQNHQIAHIATHGPIKPVKVPWGSIFIMLVIIGTIAIVVFGLGGYYEVDWSSLGNNGSQELPPAGQDHSGSPDSSDQNAPAESQANKPVAVYLVGPTFDLGNNIGWISSQMTCQQGFGFNFDVPAPYTEAYVRTDQDPNLLWVMVPSEQTPRTLGFSCPNSSVTFIIVAK